MKKTIFLLTLSLIFAGPVFAQDEETNAAKGEYKQKLKEARKDLRTDWKDYQEDRHELKSGSKDLVGDFRHGEISKQEFKDGLKDIRSERKDLRGTRKELKDRRMDLKHYTKHIKHHKKYKKKTHWEDRIKKVMDNKDVSREEAAGIVKDRHIKKVNRAHKRIDKISENKDIPKKDAAKIYKKRKTNFNKNVTKYQKHHDVDRKTARKEVRSLRKENRKDNKSHPNQVKRPNYPRGKSLKMARPTPHSARPAHGGATK